MEIRAKQRGWIDNRKERLVVAEQKLQVAIKAMQAETSSLARSFAGVWGREMAANSGDGIGELMFPSVEFWSKVVGEEVAIPKLHRMNTAQQYIEKVSPGDEQKHPPLLAALLAVLSALTRGRLSVLRRQEAIGRVGLEPEALRAFERLNMAITKLRLVGDQVDVDTRMLPLTWTLDLDWVCPPTERKHVPCPLGCGQQIFVDQVNLPCSMHTHLSIEPTGECAHHGGLLRDRCCPRRL